ncbi:hypothetical protein BDF21DRAFT_466392 [Thamnidium elegans]|nr:hypothetical protein BDF21DRAFT_466392 [Thamnidium elegans]
MKMVEDTTLPLDTFSPQIKENSIFASRGYEMAPVKQQLEEGIQVLDSACGHGAPWTIDMAKKYPNSQVFGIDISDGFPSKQVAPINTSFSTANICKTIPSLNNTFGFTFQRLNLKELYRVLKPGGFVELLGHNLTCYNAGPLLTTLTDRIFQGFNKVGLVVHISTELDARLKEVGFINCVTTTTDYPINYGEYADANWRSMRGPFRALRPLLADVYKEWEDKDVYDIFLDALTKELAEYKSYVKFYSVYAQKL